MASKSAKNKKQWKPNANREKRRIRILQIVVIVFSILLILSMVLSLTNI